MRKELFPLGFNPIGRPPHYVLVDAADLAVGGYPVALHEGLKAEEAVQAHRNGGKPGGRIRLGSSLEIRLDVAQIR